MFVWSLVSSAWRCIAWGVSPAHRRQEEGARLLRTVKFDTATDLASVPSMYAADSGRHVLARVIEIGGAVEESSGDTLVIHLIYVVSVDGSSATPRYQNAAGRHVLPDRVVVVARPGTRIEDFHQRGNAPSFVRVAVLFSVLACLVGLGVYNLHH